jgi:murein DD-endopeptidase MepM/ murein hydrolase activator NlpD
LLSLILGGITPASADSLKDAREKVRKQMVTAKKAVNSGKSALARAEAALLASQRSLAQARADLNTAETRLTAARAADAVLVAQLKVATDAATAAAAVERQAQQEVDKQKDLIAVAARTAYQQQTGLQGWALVFGAETPRDLASRVQWNQTIFDTTAVQFQHLSELERQAEVARQQRVAAQKAVADKRKASAANVVATQKLADQADQSRAKVATLVATNARLRKVAETELAADKKAYDRLQAEEAKLTAKISGDDSNYYNPNGFIRPVNAPAGSPFGMRYHPILHYWRMHWGTDFGASCGTPIRAMANGKVVEAGPTSYGFGKWTVISYGRMYGANLSSGYAHQSKIVVHAGQSVKQGQIVGYVGTTGLSTGCHLHLQIYRNGQRVNPMRYL